MKKIKFLLVALALFVAATVAPTGNMQSVKTGAASQPRDPIGQILPLDLVAKERYEQQRLRRLDQLNKFKGDPQIQRLPFNVEELLQPNWRDKIQQDANFFSSRPSMRLTNKQLGGVIVADRLYLPDNLEITADTLLLVNKLVFEGENVLIKGNHNIYIFSVEDNIAARPNSMGKGKVTYHNAPDSPAFEQEFFSKNSVVRGTITIDASAPEFFIPINHNGDNGGAGTDGPDGSIGSFGGTGLTGNNGRCPTSRNGGTGGIGPTGGNGTDAQNGTGGMAGGNGGDVVAHFAQNEVNNYIINSRGGDGGIGGKGGKGGKGGAGGGGGEGGAGVSCACNVGSGGNGGDGGVGGNGGKGGNGGAGGSGGNGGDIDVFYYTNNVMGFNIGGFAGQPGPGGIGGAGGVAGTPGFGGDPGTSVCGLTGGTGSAGLSGAVGTAGTNGNVGGTGHGGNAGGFSATRNIPDPNGPQPGCNLWVQEVYISFDGGATWSLVSQTFYCNN